MTGHGGHRSRRRDRRPMLSPRCRTCGHINFFTSPASARAWAAGRAEITGVVLDQAQSLACGVAEFGTLLGAPATRADGAR